MNLSIIQPKQIELTNTVARLKEMSGKYLPNGVIDSDTEAKAKTLIDVITPKFKAFKELRLSFTKPFDEAKKELISYENEAEDFIKSIKNAIDDYATTIRQTQQKDAYRGIFYSQMKAAIIELAASKIPAKNFNLLYIVPKPLESYLKPVYEQLCKEYYTEANELYLRSFNASVQDAKIEVQLVKQEAETALHKPKNSVAKKTVVIKDAETLKKILGIYVRSLTDDALITDKKFSFLTTYASTLPDDVLLKLGDGIEVNSKLTVRS
jgi:hypothetical protein